MEEEGGRKSQFNAGVAQTERIDALQRAINGAKFNPIMQNMETGTYNYQNLIVALDCMVSEGWGKFTDKEKDQCRKLQKLLQDWLEVNPPIQHNKDGLAKLNPHKFKQLMNLFGICERKIKEFYENHDLNSPSKMQEDQDEL